MSGFLDIYVKLIIAIISFIAPLIVFLLSVFSEGVAIIKRKSKEEETQIATLLSLQMQHRGTDGSFDTKFIEKSSSLLRESEETNSRRLRLLNPHRQIIRIFSPFILALILIMADMLIKDSAFHIYNKTVSIVILLASFVSFGIGVLFLKQVAWVIIETKEMIGQDKSAISVKAEE